MKITMNTNNIEIDSALLNTVLISLLVNEFKRMKEYSVFIINNGKEYLHDVGDYDGPVVVGDSINIILVTISTTENDLVTGIKINLQNDKESIELIEEISQTGKKEMNYLIKLKTRSES